MELSQGQPFRTSAAGHAADQLSRKRCLLATGSAASVPDDHAGSTTAMAPGIPAVPSMPDMPSSQCLQVPAARGMSEQLPIPRGQLSPMPGANNLTPSNGTQPPDIRPDEYAGFFRFPGDSFSNPSRKSQF